VLPEGFCQRKIPVTPSGIELATFRAVPQPTAPPCVPPLITYYRKFLVYKKSLPNVVCALEKSFRRGILMWPLSDKLNFNRHAEESSFYHCYWIFRVFILIFSSSVFFKKSLHKGIKCDVMLTEYVTIPHISQDLLHGY
jgi:hypothetical protein